MRTVMIESETVTSDAGDEILPVIPFDQFPKGKRSAGPDKDGNLVWTIIVED